MDHSKATNAPGLEHRRQILEERQKVVRAEFIQVELDLAITFCQIALSSDDRETIERNATHAQEAHDSALRFLGTAQISEPLKTNLAEKIEHLRKLLDEVKKKQSANARTL